MKLDYFFFYTVASIVCIAIFVILLLNDRRYGTKQEKQIWFNRTGITHICYFVSDLGWAALIGGQLPRTRFLVILFNFSNYVLLSLLAYGWFMYMASTEDLPFRKERKKRILLLLPIFLSAAAIVIAYLIAPEFWVSRENELSTLYYPLFILAPVIYIFSAFIISMRNARKARSRETRRLYRLIGIYPLSVVFFGLLQTFLLDAPLFCFGCTVMMLYFYIQNMQTLVSIDALTRLNNRGQIDRFMDQARYRENTRFYAAMIDLNRFKAINDTYGHGEGDRALILAAEALKETAEQMQESVFIGRYGGDEFALFVQTEGGAEVMDQMAEEIDRRMDVKEQENHLPYDLKISIGYDFLQDEKDTMEACLARADEKLYRNKQAAGIQRV